jgi:hypothetical protein
MGRFVNGKCSFYFSCIMGFVLFLINAVGLIPIGGKSLTHNIVTIVQWWIYVLITLGFIIYLGMIVIVIKAPVLDLSEKDDDEYDDEGSKVIVYDNDISTKSQ